jgi:SAM-dependent methyltransferase
LNVLDLLLRSRPAFGEESERAALASTLDAHLPRGNLKWLDVGVGNGANLIYLLRELEKERRFKVVAIDPQVSPAADAFAGWPVSFHRTKLEDFDLKGPYDCINVRQSCYYLDRPADSIVRLADTLSAAGTMAITLWAPNCILRGLHRIIAEAVDTADPAVMADDLLRALPEKKFQVLARRQESAILDVDLVQHDGGVAAALVGLAARTLNIAGMSQDNQADLCRNFLRERKQISRINEIVVVGRAPSTDPL